jgi:hypothetical protein
MQTAWISKNRVDILHGVAQWGEMNFMFHPLNGSLWLPKTISIDFAHFGAQGAEITESQGVALGSIN